MAPTFELLGTAQSSTGTSVNVAWPTHLTNDIGLLIIETSGNSATLTPPAGWAAVPGTPVVDVATIAGSKLHVWWKRATSAAEPAVATGTTGDHVLAMIATFRGCIQTGNPWDVTTTGIKTTASTTATIPSVTTTIDDTRVVMIVGRPNDNASTAHFGTPIVGPSLTNQQRHGEAGTTLGNGGGFVVCSAVDAIAGSTGTSTSTKTVSTTDTYVVIALRPAPLTYELIASTIGQFAVSGTSTGLIFNRILNKTVRNFLVSGTTTTLSYNLNLDLNAGAYSTVGNLLDVNAQRILNSTVNDFNLSGINADLNAVVKLNVYPGKFFLPERNLIANSESVDQWTASIGNTTVSANAAFAPDGTLTADKVIVANVTNAAVRRSQQFPAFKRGQSYVISCYVKAAELTSVAVFFNTTYTTTDYFGSAYWLNLSTGTPSNVDLNVQDVGNGWYRVWLVQTADTDGVAPSGGHSLCVTPGSTGNVNSVSGNGTDGIYVWGAQFEEGTSPSNYDPTGPAAGATTQLNYNRILNQQVGSYLVDGVNVDLTYQQNLAATLDAIVGALTLTGNPIQVNVQRTIVGQTQSYAVSGTTTGLLKSLAINAIPGTFTVVGNSLGLSFARTLDVTSGGFAVVGYNLGLNKLFQLDTTNGGFSVQGQDADFNLAKLLYAQVGSFNIFNLPSEIIKRYPLTASSASFVLNTPDIDYFADRNLKAVTGQLDIYVQDGSNLFTYLTNKPTILPKATPTRRNQWVYGRFTHMGRRFL